MDDDNILIHDSVWIKEDTKSEEAQSSEYKHETWFLH
jgi:hypothetical protein